MLNFDHGRWIEAALCEKSPVCFRKPQIFKTNRTMKKILLSCLMLGALSLMAQKKLVKSISNEVSQSEYQSHIYFLASDEMRGRNTATTENAIAARYIAERFRSYGVEPVQGQSGYMQEVSLVKTVPPAKASISVGDSIFDIWEDMIFITSENVNLSAEMVYAGFGFAEDLDSVDIKGKIIIAKAGNGNPAQGSYKFSFQKQQLVRERGGLALIELYRPPCTLETIGKLPFWKYLQSRPWR